MSGGQIQVKVCVDDVSAICNLSEDQIIDDINQEGMLYRKGKYVSRGKRELIRRERNIIRKVKCFFSKSFPNLEEWFVWTQCQNSEYNKYYVHLVKDVKENIDKYKQVYNLLYDDKSRQSFLDIMLWRLTLRGDYLIDAFSLSDNNQYFEKFLRLTSTEVFVDCGGYVGDSTLGLIDFSGGYRKYIYMRLMPEI